MLKTLFSPATKPYIAPKILVEIELYALVKHLLIPLIDVLHSNDIDSKSFLLTAINRLIIHKYYNLHSVFEYINVQLIRFFSILKIDICL